MKSLDYLFERAIPEPNSGCWIWTGSDNGSGYGTLKAGPHRYAHRAAYAAKFGAIPAGKHLDHLCRVRCCINPDHLEPVLPAENTRRGRAGHHMKNGGATLTGDAHPKAVLTSRDVRSIRQMRREGARVAEIAETFGVSRCNIRLIVLGKTWRHVA